MSLFRRSKATGIFDGWFIDPSSRAYTLSEVCSGGEWGFWAASGSGQPDMLIHPAEMGAVTLREGGRGRGEYPILSRSDPRVPKDNWHHNQGCACFDCSHPEAEV